MKEIDGRPCSTYLNKEFWVKISGLGYHTLAGWPLLSKVIGEEMAFRAIRGAIDSGLDKWTWKLRRGLKIDFYSK